jgi:hypothetical protein
VPVKCNDLLYFQIVLCYVCYSIELLNGPHQLLAYADDVNLLKSTRNKNTETLIDISKEVGLEVNVERTKYMLVSRDQNAGQNREIKIGNRSSENVLQFKYLGTTVTNQNLIQEEIKKRFHSGNACCHSVKNLLSSRLWFYMGVKHGL